MAKILKNDLIETDQDLFRKTIKDRITHQEWNQLAALAGQSNEMADFLLALTEWLYGGGNTPPTLPDGKTLLELIGGGPSELPVWFISEDNPTDTKSGDFWFRLMEGIEEVDSTPLSVDIDPEPFEYETHHDDNGNVDFTPLGVGNDSEPFEQEVYYDNDGNFILNKEII